MPEAQPPATPAQTFVLVFVYGTLKRGHQRSHVLDGQTFIGEAATTADYRMYNLGDYPGLKEVDPGSGVQVQGEIYQVDQACLRQLDQIEAVDQGLYERREVRLSPLKDSSLRVDDSTLAYFYLGGISNCNGCSDCW